MLHNYVAIAANHFSKRISANHPAAPTTSESLKQLIARCVADTYAGHAFVLVDQSLLAELSEFIEAIPEQERPLVLWQNRLYLARYFRCEERLSRYLEKVAVKHAQNSVDPKSAATEEMIDGTVNKHLPADQNGYNEGQRYSVRHALGSTFTVISGGPGTGKTTTVKALLNCFRELRPNCRIALVAPTGKAASRLSEADSTTQAEVSTLHKLIGRRPNGNVGFDSHRLLPHDLIVVDEASMVDLVLADQLVAALNSATHLVLLGDSNQLDAVETGTFFHELCRPSPYSANWLCKLTHTYRFDANSKIAGAAKAIESGDSENIGEFIHPIAWQSSAAQVEELCNGYHAYIAAIVALLESKDAGAEFKALFDSLNGFRVLVAVNDGISGQKQLALAIDLVIRQRVLGALHSGRGLFHGQALVFTKNNALLGVNNGDLAIVINNPLAANDDRGTLTDAFKILLVDGRQMSANLLQDYTLAWAMTVHKSQGSEFDQVAFVMPGRAVDRALLYTAVTRAKKQFVAYGSLADIETSALRSNPRRASILARLGFFNPI
jgi:exodeoxyribonuclease V alpha subunit